MKLLHIITIAVFTVFTLTSISGCASIQNMIVEDSLKGTKGSEDPKKVAAFEEKFHQVIDDVDNKKDYKKIPLDGEEDIKWFMQQSFKLWDKQISKEEYVKDGEGKFPGHNDTFTYLADEFTK